jgi:hypothetical protein
MTSDLHARLLTSLNAHGILTVGGVTMPAQTAHATLRDALRRRFPSGLGSYAFWRAGAPDELHCSSPDVAAAVDAAAERLGIRVATV